MSKGRKRYSGTTDLKPLNKLPKRQQAFLRHYVLCGCSHEAYKRAGYTGHADTRKARVSKLLKDLAPYVRESFNEYIEGVEIGVLGVKVIRELAENAESEQVRLNAARELKSLSIKEDPKETIVHTVNHTALTNEQVDKRLAELQEALWKDAPKLEVVK